MSVDDWFRNRWRRYWPFYRGPFFEDIDDMMKQMERMFEESYSEFQKLAPKDLVRERKLPDGSTVREIGPMVYGYSMTIGPDGKPVIREFGNVRPSKKMIPGAPPLEVAEHREPLVDVIEEQDLVRVVAELPGVDKTDINLAATEEAVTIDVDAKGRRYHKDVQFPAKVDPESSKASYKNGILELVFKKFKPSKPKGTSIKIE